MKKFKKFKTKQDYIDFFEAIPAKKWRTDELGEGKTHCAIGHLYADKDGLARSEIYCTFSKVFNIKLDKLADVNDNFHPHFNSKKLKTPSIKKRVLAYLKSL